MPPYPEKLINEGETVVLDLKPHWWFFWKHIAAGAVLVAVLVAWVGPLDSGSWAQIPLALGILVYLAFVIVKYLNWTYTHFVLTDRRVISRTGIISKRGTEIPLDRVNNIDFSQRLFERLIGAGDLSIESAGKDGQSHFENVRHPDMVQQEIYRQIEVNSRRQAGWHADAIANASPGIASAPAPAVPGPDVADQITKLAALRDQGAITAEEYEAKKAELLDRM
jgi:membrane protein YdbS with pleckstrin-like domain